MDTTEKKKKSPRRPIDKMVWVGIASFIMCFVIYGYLTTGQPRCDYDTNTLVDYSTLIAQCNPSPNLMMGLLIIGIPAVIGLALVAFARSKIIAIVLLLPACVCSVCGSWSAWMPDPSVEHISSIEFDGHIYHLAQREYYNIDVGSEYTILLFECEQDETTCRGRKIEKYIEQGDSLRVNETMNQLQVVADDEILFTLDARQIPAPESLQKLAPITPDNAGDLQELINLNYDTGDLVWSSDGTRLFSFSPTGIWQFMFDAFMITTRTDMVQNCDCWLSVEAINLLNSDYDIGISYKNPFEIWDITHNQLLKVLPDNISDIYWSSDGKWLITYSWRGDIVLYDAQHLEARHRATLKSSIEYVTISPDGQYLAAYSRAPYSWDNQNREVSITILELATGAEIFSQKYSELVMSWYLPSLIFSPDSKYLVANGEIRETQAAFVMLINIAQKAEQKIIHEQRKIMGIAFNPDGEVLGYSTDYWPLGYSSPAESNYLHLLKISDGSEKLLPFDEQGDINGGIVFSPDGTLVVGTNHSATYLWSAITGELAAKFEISAYILAFRPDGRVLATSSYGSNAITLWGVPEE